MIRLKCDLGACAVGEAEEIKEIHRKINKLNEEDEESREEIEDFAQQHYDMYVERIKAPI